MRHGKSPILAAVITLSLAPAVAQDIRGLEICTAEKQMDRRTSCLQANTEFLQQALDRHQREAQRKLAAADAEIAALKARLAKLEDDLAQLKKAGTKPATDKK
jgi:septal ring factor EnvC (AmiA/AmiB activator)